MATITTILASDIIASSRVTLNTNFANLNTDKVDINSTYADPAWITSLAGSKITGNIGGNAATATALATARTIAGVSFDGTANIAIPSTGLSDSSDIVRGGASVASGQVLYGTGAGVAGSEAAFGYNAATDTLSVFNATINNTTPTTGVTQFIVRAGAGQSTTNLTTWQNNGGTALAGINGVGSFFTGNNANATGDSLIDANGLRFGSTVLVRWSNNLPVNAADLSLSRASGNTLQVGDGGSNANGGLFASSIGVGVTPSIAANVNQVIIRAGSAQSTTNLTTWQNSSGTTLAAIGSTGRMFSPRFTTLVDSGWALQDDFDSSWPMLFASGRGIAWSSTTSFAGSKDISLSRAGVNIGQFGDGGSNSNGLLYLKGVRPVGSTVANLPTASGNTGMMATVTDATVTTIGTTVAGGGGNTVLVWSNGTNWRIYAN
jgi:hypothetical protein